MDLRAIHPRPGARARSGPAPRALDLWALGLALLVGLLLLAALQRVENVSGDSARYIGLADALREDGRYELDARPHTRFPPGFPLLLAAVRGAVGEAYARTLGAVALQSALAAWAGYALLRGAGRPGVGLWSLVLLATSPYFFERATRAVAPEPAYVASSFAALWLVAALARGALRPGVIAAAALAVCVVASIALRSIGVALLAPLAVCLALPSLRRRFGPGGAALWPALAAGVGAQLAWARWQAAHRVELWPGEFMHSYAAQVWLRDPHRPELGRATAFDWVERALDNGVEHAAAFAELATHLPWVEARWLSPLVVLPIVLGGLGVWRRLFSGAADVPVLEVYTLAYLALVLVWPFDEGPRFVLAVFPLALLYGVEGAAALAERAAAEPRRARRAAGAAAAALLVGGLAHEAQRGGTPGWQTLAALACWAALAGGLVLPVEKLAFLRSPALRRAALALALAACLGVGALQIRALARENVSASSTALRHPETLDAAAWLAEHATPGATVLAGQEAVVHYLTGAHGIPFPVTSDPEVLRGVLVAQGVRYWVVLEHEPFPYFLPVERERLELFEAAFPGVARDVHRGPGYRILEVDPGRASTARR